MGWPPCHTQSAGATAADAEPATATPANAAAKASAAVAAKVRILMDTSSISGLSFRSR
jgi:hypothetical protein